MPQTAEERKEYQRQYRAKHRERLLQMDRDRYHKKMQDPEWVEKERERSRVKSAKELRENPERVREKGRKSYYKLKSEGPEMNERKARYMKQRARDRSRVLRDYFPIYRAWEMLIRTCGRNDRWPMTQDMTFWHVPWRFDCPSCGVDLNWKDRTERNGAHFDRIDSRKPYEPGNVQILCRTCNLSKPDRSPDREEDIENYVIANPDRF